MMKLSARAIAFAVAVLAAPTCVYIWKFGFQLSADHTRWGEFGSAMSGIYTPVLALATLAVLLMQVSLQKQVHDHDVDQAFIQQARADVEFYVQRLAEVLTIRLSYGNQAEEILRAHFQPPAIADLDSQQLRDLSTEVDEASPRIYALWSAIQAILAGLSATDQAPFRMVYTATLQKLIAMLGFESCVALEHFHRVRTQGRLAGSYHFSPLLAPNSGP
jgi:hypothetical protein